MSFNYKDGEDYTCTLCGETKHTKGPRPDNLCDGCWELSTRVKMQPHLARRVLASLVQSTEQDIELYGAFRALFKACGLEKVVEAGASVAAEFDLVFDPDTLISSVAHDCVELTKIKGSKSFSFTDTDAVGDTAGEVLHILTYELGKVVEYYHKAKRYGATGYYCIENQQKEVSDLISMVRKYCELRGWDYEVLKHYGEQCYLERQADLRDYSIGGKEKL